MNENTRKIYEDRSRELDEMLSIYLRKHNNLNDLQIFKSVIISYLIKKANNINNFRFAKAVAKYWFLGLTQNMPDLEKRRVRNAIKEIIWDRYKGTKTGESGFEKFRRDFQKYFVEKNIMKPNSYKKKTKKINIRTIEKIKKFGTNAEKRYFLLFCLIGKRISEPIEIIEENEKIIFKIKRNKTRGKNLITSISYSKSDLKKICKKWGIDLNFFLSSLASSNTIQNHFQNLSRKINNVINSHICRNLFQKNLFRHNIPKEKISLAMGHTSTKTGRKYAKGKGNPIFPAPISIQGNWEPKKIESEPSSFDFNLN